MCHKFRVTACFTANGDGWLQTILLANWLYPSYGPLVLCYSGEIILCRWYNTIIGSTTQLCIVQTLKTNCKQSTGKVHIHLKFACVSFFIFWIEYDGLDKDFTSVNNSLALFWSSLVVLNRAKAIAGRKQEKSWLW